MQATATATGGSSWCARGASSCGGGVGAGLLLLGGALWAWAAAAPGDGAGMRAGDGGRDGERDDGRATEDSWLLRWGSIRGGASAAEGEA